ncbi:MAG: transposase [Armatimonadota bacterium]
MLTPRGIKVRQLVELRRDWYWLAVAVVPRTGVLEAQWMGTLGSTDFLFPLQDWHAAGIDVLVWDGLPGHRGVLPTDTPVPTIIQPAASPELNPAERVGEAIRAAIEGRVYATLWEKMLAVESVLHALQTDRKRVKQLTGYPWILDVLKELPWRGSG